jgi:2-dehydropantoate 2-reductase
MTYVVLGAGAIGGTIGGRLALAGHDVALVARGAHGEAIRRDGLRLRDPERDDVIPIPCAATPAERAWRGDEVVVLATKVHQADAALDALAAAAPPSIEVVCATNGLEGERLALRRFAGVHGMCVNLPAEHLVPGVVSAYSAPTRGILDVGRYPAGTEDLTRRIAADLGSAGFASRADADVMARKRQKLLMNVANVLDAACSGQDTADLWQAARAEAEAAFRAAGVSWTTDEDDRARRAEAGLGMHPVGGERRAGGSTHQSLARGTGDTEADYLNGEVVLLGRLHGVGTPVNELLQRLARELATSGAAPGSVDADDLRARLG